MKSTEIKPAIALVSEIKTLIEQSRQQIAVTVNATISLLYWKIGKRINDEIFKDKRAEHGKQIVSSLRRQLSWTHLIPIIPIEDPLKCELYQRHSEH